MSESIPETKPGKPAFYLGQDNQLTGMVVTGVQAHTRRLVWTLKKTKPGNWSLKTSWEVDGNEVESAEKPVSIKAETWELAQQKAKAVLRARRNHAAKIVADLRKQGALPCSPFEGLSISDQERIVDAWTMANKPMWPNLFSLSKDEKDQSRISEAITADMVAMGFPEVVTHKIAKMSAKTETGCLDKFNVWLIENWFHGEKLVGHNPKSRLEVARKHGHSASEKGLGMRLTRLALTARKKRQ